MLINHSGIESDSQREIGVLEEGVNGWRRREENDIKRHFKIEVEGERKGGILDYSQVIGLGG